MLLEEKSCRLWSSKCFKKYTQYEAVRIFHNMKKKKKPEVVCWSFLVFTGLSAKPNFAHLAGLPAGLCPFFPGFLSFVRQKLLLRKEIMQLSLCSSHLFAH